MIRILSIGNSFSRDAMHYVHKIGESVGDEIETINLYIGGCSLETHWNNVTQDAPKYLKEVNGISTEQYVSIREELEGNKLTHITLQQASHLSVNEATYEPYISNLHDYVKQLVPTATILLHQTWAYEEGSDKLKIQMGYQNQTEMYKDLERAYSNIKNKLKIATMIPCGWGFQQMLKKGFSNLHIDTFHASWPYGRYILGAIWYETLTGKNIKDTTYCPEGMDTSEWQYLKDSIHEIMEEWR